MLFVSNLFNSNIRNCLSTFTKTLPIVSSIILAPSLANTSLECSMVVASTITSAVSLVTLTLRYRTFKNYILSTYSTFLLLTYLMVNTNSVVTIFIIYELFLLPSAALVWFFSPNKRGVKTTLFFLVWTQFGSILILLATLYIVLIGDITSFICESHYRSIPKSYQYLILLGFLIKIPVFPFYFWLTKTHVEAVTSFSIFLSGFLVKVAIFGMYKYIIFLSPSVIFAALPLLFFSASITSLLFLYQVDLKKIVAYATIQEMSQLAMCLLLFWATSLDIVSLFLVTHTILSAKYFLINDIVYRSYNTRSILAITGLGIISPKLSVVIVSTLSLFRGLPFTLKNSVEMTVAGGLLSVSGLLAAS